jgi:lathosterol oxidase
MDALEALLRDASPPVAVGLLTAQNVLLFALAVGLGELWARRIPGRRVCAPAPPLGAHELGLAACTVVLNVVITYVGLELWRRGIIVFRRDLGPRVLLDVAVLLVGMDLAMYVLHRAAHHPWLFPILHRSHHRYDRPRPLTLFVLNPAETLAFGGLWLVVVSVYEASWLGMAVYLGLNVAFGAVGHLGVEPCPPGWSRRPVLGLLGTSSFHAQHHAELHNNFGFYTLVWDRLFGSLAPDYAARLETAARGEPPGA